jgi:RNA polymerase sigma-70 factor
MEQVPELSATFLAHSKPRSAPCEEPATLQRLLVHAWETSRARWPGVALPAEHFVVHLAERLPEAGSDSSLEPRLAQLSLAELYLACACVRGLPSAIEHFERDYLSKLPGLLRGPRQSEALLDDVCQVARVKLLVPTPEGPPKLAEYAGRGSLLGWLKVTAVRISIRLQETEKPAWEEDVDLLDDALPAPGFDTELDLIKRRHHDDFRAAVREAYSSLSADERHLLRLHYVDQLSSYELAPLFRVNQSTISRWMKSARQSVYDETRRRLQERLGLSPQDFQSFLAGLGSQFAMGLSQLLKEEGQAPKKD